MRNKLLICFIGLTVFANCVYASEGDSTKIKPTIGAIGGFSQNSSLSGYMFLGSIIPINSDKTQINLGYTFFRNNTDYEGVNDIGFRSHGLYVEGNYHLIKGLYVGVKYGINFNWVDKESQKKFDIIPDTDSPTFFSGIAGYGHIGYCLPIGNYFGIKIQGQVGLHNYKIAEGWLLIDNSSSDLRNAQMGIYRHAEFLYNLSIGLTYKLR